MVYPSGHADLTADGEAFDQTALAAAHQTLQLPAIARLTNLENGRQVLVRINDRGPATPHRLVEVTRRTATLLGFPATAWCACGCRSCRRRAMPRSMRCRARRSWSSRRRRAGRCSRAICRRPAARRRAAPRASDRAAQARIAGAPRRLRLPETVTQGVPDPGNLFVRLGTFQNFEYANIQRARVAGLGARIVSTREGRVQTHRVIIGPLASVQQADVVLDQVLAAGVTDARIVVE